ncbi:MAG: hypothetical protein J0L67_05805 [Cytophagales bacterium]|nr:hypothetical protein [Cytophagales bacterium]
MFKLDFNIQSMKILRVLSLLLVSAVLLTYMGCDGGGSTPEPIEDVQFTKLAKTWKITSVSYTGTGPQDRTAEYKDLNFQLVLNGTKGSPPFTYSTSGRPNISPWKANGTWEFGSAVETQIVRDKGVTADELGMTYVVTENTLTLTFSFLRDGYPARTEQVEGNWIFTFGL